MAPTIPTTDHEQARDELARAIRTRRSDCSPHEVARQLLAYDRPGHTALLGIDFDASRAVLYHERDRYAITVRFGPEGLADGGAVIAGFEDGPRVESWVETMAAYWGWLHPRFR